MASDASRPTRVDIMGFMNTSFVDERNSGLDFLAGRMYAAVMAQATQTYVVLLSSSEFLGCFWLKAGFLEVTNKPDLPPQTGL
jgi:hypothetical protein